MKQFMEIAGRRVRPIWTRAGTALGHSYLWDSAMWAPKSRPLRAVSLHRARALGSRGFRCAARGPCTLATLARDHLALLDALASTVHAGGPPSVACGAWSWRMAPARLRAWC